MRKWPILGAMLLGLAGSAWAVTTGTYTDIGGNTRDALGVAVVSPSAGPNVSITRTNDILAYAAGDVVGAAPGATGAVSFALGTPAGEYSIACASLEIDAAAIIAGETTYTLYLYNVTPPSALGDNVAWDLPAGDRASFLGSINLGTPADLGSTLYAEQCNINKSLTSTSANVFGYLVTVGAYTPTASRVYKVTLHSVAGY